MIIDTSALVAVVRGEPDAARFFARSAIATRAEAHVGGELSRGRHRHRREPQPDRQSADFDDLIAQAGIMVEPVTLEQADIARAAYRDFGKGSGHPAALNFGDCFAYALAKSMREPLLFKGDDFSHTDVAIA